MPKKAASKVGKPGRGEQEDKHRKATRAQFKKSSGVPEIVHTAKHQSPGIGIGRKQANTSSSWADFDPRAPRPDRYRPRDEEYDAPGYGKTRMSSPMRDRLDQNAPKNTPFTEDGMMPPPPPPHMPQHANYDMSAGSQYYIDNPDEQPMATGPGLSRANAIRQPIRPLPGPGLHRSNATHWPATSATYKPYKPEKKKSVSFMRGLASALGWGSGTSNAESINARRSEQSDNVVKTPIQVPSAYDCLICMERVLSEQKVLECPQYQCRRPYHADCIKNWLEQCDNSCPHCKQIFQLPSAPAHAPDDGAGTDSGTLQQREPHRVPTLFERGRESIQKEFGKKVRLTMDLNPGVGGVQILRSSDIPVKSKKMKVVPGF